MYRRMSIENKNAGLVNISSSTEKVVVDDEYKSKQTTVKGILKSVYTRGPRRPGTPIIKI